MTHRVIQKTVIFRHWRHADLAQSLLSLMIRKDTVFTKEGIAVFIKLITHDSIKTRKMSIGFLGAWLKITRPKALKKPISLTVSEVPVAEAVEGAGDSSGSITGTTWPVKWGIREDSVKFLYRKETLPKSADEWERTEFVEKTHWGFYPWPK